MNRFASIFSPRKPTPEGGFELVVFIKGDWCSHALAAQGVARVGRGFGNDIRIQHRSVSRRHLRIYLGEQLEVEDVGSSNGTWLVPAGGAPDGLDDTAHDEREQRLTKGHRHPIHPGDMIRMGRVLLGIQRRTAPATAAGQTAQPLIINSKMKALYERAAKTASSSIPVLILGETGVGKDVLAEAIHRSSPRAAGPFVRLNCGALSQTLLESELFGYSRGAFTGATDDKQGLIEAADGGTLFLDEVGELTPSTQVKLLHALERMEVLRVGSTEPRRINVRFISATNRDLGKAMVQNEFRKDLFFRLNGVRLVVPPLRERPDEIEPLAEYFLARSCAASGIPVPAITEEARAELRLHSWPGNVRELRSAMELAAMLCGGGPILPVHLERVEDESRHDEDSQEWTAVTAIGEREDTEYMQDERQRIVRALGACQGNQTRAAVLLGISRRTLVSRLAKLGIPRPRKKLV